MIYLWKIYVWDTLTNAYFKTNKCHQLTHNKNTHKKKPAFPTIKVGCFKKNELQEHEWELKMRVRYSKNPWQCYKVPKIFLFYIIKDWNSKWKYNYSY